MGYVVTVGYDQDAQRYFVQSSDIPGLNIEAESFEAFVEVVQDVAADLVGHRAAGSKIRIQRSRPGSLMGPICIRTVLAF